MTEHTQILKTASGFICILEAFYLWGHRAVYSYLSAIVNDVKGKAIPVTGHEGPQDCKTSRLSHILDNRITDGSKVVSLTCHLSFTPQWYSVVG
jgi:hypothetical protein